MKDISAVSMVVMRTSIGNQAFDSRGVATCVGPTAVSLSVCLSACLSAFLSACLYVCLSV